MPATIAPEFIPSACDVEVCLHDRRPRWRERTVRGGFAVAALIAVLIAIASILSSSPNTQHTAKSSSLGEKYMLEDIPCRADCGDEGAQNGQEHAVVKVNDLRSTSRTLSQGNMEQQKDVKDRSEHISLQQKEEEAAEVAWYQRHLPSLAMDGANNYDMDCFYHHEVEWCMKLHAKQKAAGSVGDIMRAAMKKKLSKNKEVLRGSDQATQRVISARASGKVTHPTSSTNLPWPFEQPEGPVARGLEMGPPLQNGEYPVNGHLRSGSSGRVASNAKHSTVMTAGELARDRDSLAAKVASRARMKKKQIVNAVAAQWMAGKSAAADELLRFQFVSALLWARLGDCKK